MPTADTSCLNEVDLGLPLAAGMTALIRSRLTPTVFRDVILTGARIGGAAACERGIADEAASGPDVLPRAMARAAALAGKDRGAYAALKRGMYTDVIEQLASGRDLTRPPVDALPLSTHHRALGRSPLSAFPLAYGCWRFAGTDVRTARAILDAALEVGITLFDHADIYGGDGAAEELFGRVLADAPHLRERMLIGTKCGVVVGVPYDASRAPHPARGRGVTAATACQTCSTCTTSTARTC